MKISLLSDSTYDYDVIRLDEIKEHLRILPGQTREDNSLISMRYAAIEHTENFLNRKLSPKTYKLYLNDFPSENYIEIPFPPLREIPSTGLLYTDSTGGVNTLSSTKWTIDRISEPGRLVLNYSDYWPTATLAENNPISLEFICGYGSTEIGSAGSTNIKLPNIIKHGTLMIIGSWYEAREDAVQTAFEFKTMPLGVKNCLWPLRIKTF